MISRNELENIDNAAIRRVALAYYDYYYMPAEDTSGEQIQPWERTYRVHDHRGGHLCEQCFWTELATKLRIELSTIRCLLRPTHSTIMAADKRQIYHSKWIELRNANASAITHNPVMMDPVIIEFSAPKTAWFGGYIAEQLQSVHEQVIANVPVFRLDHAVAQINRSKGLDTLYSSRDEDKSAMYDLFAYAPVLIYSDNVDGRGNGAIADMLVYRQYGVAIFLKEGKW